MQRKESKYHKNTDVVYELETTFLALKTSNVKNGGKIMITWYFFAFAVNARVMNVMLNLSYCHAEGKT